MTKTKDIALISIYSALLVAAQYVLGFVAGIELVTVMLLSFSYYFGPSRGAIVSVCFSLLRCLVWGFYPTVFILYIAYYPLFAIAFGYIGKWLKLSNINRGIKIVIVVILALILTCIFTLLDDVITPVFYGFNLNAAKAYFISSLPTMLTQVICNLITVSILFPILTKLFKTVYKNGY